ncbi:peptidylprolyl isomerase [Shewanella intestini]|uniref:Peptidyl-prolyl cis-trans isomerase n=1 Tax=Shewanella intestini TaxID=2017544 RepID=A0ABS5HZ99_9GAMM|nr:MULTISPECIES: peptidylprolyl isomerase [Shewanella]MBR9726380.1 peptidyl-prolyl cis-trans isomerase [Shewanella intestini]MRG35054.1 peptidyl-prolyl cis-trans isomerase [Shewanella sp. XMDDZSB0408]
MFKWIATSIMSLVIGLSSTYAVAKVDIQPDTIYPKVKLSTTMGDIVVELDRKRAPITVDNFLTYVVKGEYDNTIFHRVIQDFVVQGGGLDPQFEEAKPSLAPIVNESGNGLSNSIGTIAMARDNNPHSATKQFYFNVADNVRLDPSKRRWGYAVFGEIVSGLDVVEAISMVTTGQNQKLGWPDVPVKNIILTKATLLPR